MPSEEIVFGDAIKRITKRGDFPVTFYEAISCIAQPHYSALGTRSRPIPAGFILAALLRRAGSGMDLRGDFKQGEMIMKNKLRHLCFLLIALASLTANYAEAGDQLFFKGEMMDEGAAFGFRGEGATFTIEVRENSITTDRMPVATGQGFAFFFSVKDGQIATNEFDNDKAVCEILVARKENVVILTRKCRYTHYGETEDKTQCYYLVVDGSLMTVRTTNKKIPLCPSVVPSDTYETARSTRTDFSIGQPSPSQSKPGTAGSEKTAQKGTGVDKQQGQSEPEPIKKKGCGDGYVADPRTGDCQLYKFGKSKEEIQQEQTRLEQERLERERLERIRQEAEEKQRLEDYWAKLQNPSYLQSASQGSPAQGQNTGLAQPSPAQQALDKEVDEKAPCRVKCMLVLPIKVAVQTVAVVGNFIRDFFKPGDHNNPPLGSSVCSPQSANFQECSNRLIAARGMFFGLGNPGNAEILQRQGNEGIGGSQ